MSELRYNIATGDWVIFSTARARRPHDFLKENKEPAGLPERKADCPFCPGNEKTAGEELFRIGDDKNWRVRSIPNKFPALSPGENTARKTDGFYTSMGGFGGHEVIIESPRHNTCIALMSAEEVEDIIRIYINRYATLYKMPGIETVTVFKNHGPMAGCSLEHPHSQIVATPVIPPSFLGRVRLALNYFEQSGTCVYCRMIEKELKVKSRILLETDRFVSFLPFAGALPFTIWIVPKMHLSDFAGIEEPEITGLAEILKGTLDKLYYGLSNPDFNMTIRSLPARAGSAGSFHWHLSIIPRLSEPGGFEMGTMMPINTSLPEEGAEFLRSVKCPDKPCLLK